MAAVPFSIQLNGRTYPIDPSKYRRQTQESIRSGLVNSPETTDALFNTEGAWSRYKYSWHRGAGQVMDDLRDDADPFRFSDSHMVDVWTENELRLHHPLTSALNTTDSRIIASGPYLFVSDGTALWRTVNGVNFTAMTAPGGTIRGLASDGTDLYVTTSTTTVRYLGSATTGTAFTNEVGAGDFLAFVAGRLILGTGSSLYQIAANGTNVLIKTHYQAGFVWKVTFAIGSRIYVGGYSGTRSELYSVVADSSGNLVLGSEAANLPHGEILYFGLAHAGIAVLTTSKGARFAQVGADGTLTYGPLIEILSAYAAVADGRFVWVTGSRYHNGTAYSGTVRLALDTFTEPLKPAYAWDPVIATTAPPLGVARHAVGSDANVGSTFVYFSGLGVYVEDLTRYPVSGELTSGRVYFGTVEPKWATNMVVRFDAAAAGESVSAVVTSGTSGLAVTQATGGSGESEIVIDQAQLSAIADLSEYATVKITLGGNGTSSPSLHQWRLRAYPVPPATQQWIVPIEFREKTTIGPGRGDPHPMDLVAEMASLAALWASRAPVTYVEDEASYTVRVDAFELEADGWADGGRGFRGVLNVRLVSV